MSFFTLLLLALSLAMDCFAVSCTAGVTQPKLSWKTVAGFAFSFGFFQAMMPLAGYLLGVTVSQFVDKYAPWIAFGILACIGVRMIIDAVRDQEEKIVDMTQLKSVLLLSVATSIDALAVGFSFSMMQGISVGMVVLVIGIVSFLASIVGYAIASRVGKHLKANIAEIVGGVVLIGIGLHILIG